MPADRDVVVRELSAERIGDLGRLFDTDAVADRCWCMWFLRPVNEFHLAGTDGNRAAFEELARSEPDPLGLLAYRNDEPVGWCAAGPRQRFARALRTPTLRQRDRTEDVAVWLVPCFFIRPDVRGAGVSTALLDAAVDLARSRGAAAIEGFPLAGGRRRFGGSDFMTAVEPLFAACGFEPVHRPSANRVVMRRALQ